MNEPALTPSPVPQRARFSLPPAQQALLEAEYTNMQACIRCGLCLTVCPTYLLTFAEEEGPRGRIALGRALTEGHLDLTPDLLEHENNCLLCEACTRICPAGFRMEALGVPLRQVFEQLQPGPWWKRALRQVVFRDLFGSLANFRRFAALLRLYQRSGLRWLVQRSGALRLFGLARLERYLPEIATEFLVPEGQRWEPHGSASGSAALFVGCIMSTAFADTDRATARLLARAGYQVTATVGQGCCGALNAHSGDRDGARELARRNIEAFELEPDSAVASNAAGCGAMLKEYGHLLQDDPKYANRAAGFAARVRDATELLAGRLPPPTEFRDLRPATQDLELVVTYQDACHLAHAQGITRQPRELLAQLGGVRLVEMQESSLCCGSAGIYNVLHPDQAGRLLDRKLNNALATRADTIVTANPGCLLQLQAGLAERGSAVRVRHLLDLLDEAYARADHLPESLPPTPTTR
jgi:glycolate dehydrogenase iron-sulfur subunit